MRASMLSAAILVALLVGTQSLAGDCDPCEPACDPCGETCHKSIDLFAGLKKLVACNPCSTNECGPCDGVVACTPCDNTDCNPCGDCGHKFVFGKKLRSLFELKGCETECNPCDPICDPCDPKCDPCEVACDDNGCEKVFSFKKFFKGFKLDCGSCGDNSCNPCDQACDPCAPECDPCHKHGKLFDLPRFKLAKLFDKGCDNGCQPCDPVCDPCAPECVK